MAFFVSKRVLVLLGSLAMAAILLLVAFSGINAGKTLAQANFISQSAANAAKSLQFFYQDQSRYPTSAEFSDQNVMLNYLSAYPLPNLPSSGCSQSFSYQQSSDSGFELNFCLPAAVAGYQKGWNAINGNPPS